MLYKNVKFLDLVERAGAADRVADRVAPAVVVCDGDPLVNIDTLDDFKRLEELLSVRP